MPQSITMAEAAALASKLQVGPEKRIEAEVEIDWITGVVSTGGPLLASAVGTSGGVQVSSLAAPAISPAGDEILLVALVGISSNPSRTMTPPAGWTTDEEAPGVVNGPSGANTTHHLSINHLVVSSADPPYSDVFTASGNCYWGIEQLAFRSTGSQPANSGSDSASYGNLPGATNPTLSAPLDTLPTPGHVLVAAMGVDGLGGPYTGDQEFHFPADWHYLSQTGGISGFGRVGYAWKEADGTETGIDDVYFGSNRIGCAELVIAEFHADPAPDPSVVTQTYQVASLDLDVSRKMAANQLRVALTNEDGARGYYTELVPFVVPHNPCRAYAWHGVRANRVQIFTGLLDELGEDRDPKRVSLAARSRTSLLLDPHLFIATASQDPADPDAVRTEANGVFLNKSPEYIFGAVLDAAGWPSADRDVAVSGVTIPEYRFADGSQWLDQIVGSGKLSEIAGWDYGEDELGVAKFGPNILAAALEPDPDWTFEPGVNALEYHHKADDLDRVTRIRVTGPMATTVPKWSIEWSMSRTPPADLSHPVGVMSLASDTTHIYAVDRITKYLYRIELATRKVVAKWYLGASLTNQPIGLSRDPTDEAYFYVLDAHLPGSGTYTNCKVRKFALSTKALVSTTTLPDGQWSDMKFDGTHLWLPNFGDAKLYEKTFVAGGAAGATGNSTYAGHTNPTGIFLTGTTIGIFFNGGTAFYLVDTSAPGTITGTQSTKGTHILGMEIDSTDPTIGYATNETGDFSATAGHIWKADLADDVTVDVVKWATDQDLEDELGIQAALASRTHDLHPDDDAHPWEARVASIALQTINSEAQAQAVADATLALRSRLRRTLDLVIAGNPAIQKGDAVSYPDPVAGTDAIWMLDTYRARLQAGQYTVAASHLPWEAP